MANNLLNQFETYISATEDNGRKCKPVDNHFEYAFEDFLDGNFHITIYDDYIITVNQYSSETFTGDNAVDNLFEYLGEFDIPSYDFPENILK